MTHTIDTDTDTTYATGHAMQAIRYVTEAYWSRTRQNRRFTEAGYGLSTGHDDALRWLCPDGWAVDIPASELPDVLIDWIQVLYETDQGLPEYDDDPSRYAVGSAWVGTLSSRRLPIWSIRWRTGGQDDEKILYRP